MFVATQLDRDGAAVTVFGTNSGRFYLVVRRGGCERSRRISSNEAYQYRDSVSVDVDTCVAEMKAELVHAIRQGEGEWPQGTQRLLMINSHFVPMESSAAPASDFADGWSWGHGDRLAHFYRQSRDNTHAHTICGRGMALMSALSAARADETKCTTCVRRVERGLTMRRIVP